MALALRSNSCRLLNSRQHVAKVHQRLTPTATAAAASAQRCRRLTSVARPTTQHESSSSSSSSTPKYRAMAQAMKYFRIPALVAGVGGLGYQMGVMDTIGDPAKKEKSVMKSVLMSAGCADPSDGSKTRTTTDGSWAQMSPSLLSGDPQLHRIASVGRRIVQVARGVARGARAESEAKIRAELPAEIASEARVQEIVEIGKRFDAIAAAADVMEGEWTYVLLDSPAPNAFVTSMLPRKIFVTTAMMDTLVANDDEMALVLAHEVSHLVLGHVGHRAMAEAILSTLEIVVLTTLSAAGGLGTIQAMVLLSTLKRWVSNGYSRECESAADEMGIKLAAMACYDTERGIEVFRKMQELDPPGVSFLTFELDHPPTEERYNALVQASKIENASKYESRGNYGSLKTELRRAIHVMKE